MSDSDDSWDDFGRGRREMDSDEEAWSSDDELVAVSRPASGRDDSSYGGEDVVLLGHQDSPSPSVSIETPSDAGEELGGEAVDVGMDMGVAPASEAKGKSKEQFVIPKSVLPNMRPLGASMLAALSATNEATVAASHMPLSFTDGAVPDGGKSDCRDQHNPPVIDKMIDSKWYPHLITRMFDYMDLESRLVLRATSKEWRDFVDTKLSRHIVVSNGRPQAIPGVPGGFLDNEHKLMISPLEKRPVWWTGLNGAWISFDEQAKRLLANARVVDVDVSNPTPFLCSLEGLVPRLQTIRIMNTTHISGRHEKLHAPCAVVFKPQRHQWFLDKPGMPSPALEFMLPAKTGVLNIPYNPSAKILSLIPWRLHIGHLDKLTIIFTPVGGYERIYRPSERAERFLIGPLEKMIVEHCFQTDFVFVGLLEMPTTWFAIPHDDMPNASDSQRIASQIWRQVFYSIREKYDDELYPEDQVIARLETALKYMTAEEYAEDVGAEQFALHTQPHAFDYWQWH